MTISFFASRPTPTTALFTVRNTQPQSSLSSRALFYVLIVIRAVIGAIILISFWLKWISEKYGESGSLISCQSGSNATLCAMQKSAIGTCWRYLAPAGLLGLWFVMRRGYTGKNNLCFLGEYASRTRYRMTFVCARVDILICAPLHRPSSASVSVCTHNLS